MQPTLFFDQQRSSKYHEVLRTISEKLTVKIQSLSSVSNWIKGKDHAAEACHNLQLDVAINMYLRTTFVAGNGTPTIEEAVQLIKQIGFSEAEIRERAKDQQFSAFFVKQ